MLTRTKTVLPWITRGLGWLDRLPKVAIHAVCGVLIVLIGWVTERTGPGVSVSLLFLIPVMLVARTSGLGGGVVAAVAAAAVWFFADRLGDAGAVPSFAAYWNLSMRLGTFLVAAGLVAAMCDLNVHLERRVEKRTAALEAQTRRRYELEKKLLEISDLEQVKLGHDLHDGLCQQLVSAAFSANLLRDRVPAGLPALTELAERLAREIDGSINQARDLAKGLYPARLEREGLAVALEELAGNLAGRFSVSCETQIAPDLPALPPPMAIHLYRIAQEAMVNAARHSGTERVRLKLAENRAGRLVMSVEDDGKGLDAAPGAGMGLSIMEYRARMIGADLSIGPTAGRGTVVRCVLDSHPI